MPRRTEESARQAARKEMVARIRLLIRNPQFLKDLRDLRKLDNPFGVNDTDGSPTLLQKALKAVEDFTPKDLLGPLQIQFTDTNKPIHSCWEFLRKWDIERIPTQLFIHPSEPLRGSDSVPGGEPLPQTAGDLEKIILQERNPKQVVRQAVIASEPFLDWLYKTRAEEWFVKQVNELDGTGSVLEAPDDIPRPGTVLNIKIDLSYPQDVIEAEIKREVRKAKDRRQEIEGLGLLPRRPERLRLDTIPFQLKVYDLAKAGKTFQEIHVETKSAVSTVKSAFLVVSEKIRSLVIRALLPPRVSKNTVPLIDFDSANHVSLCPQCSSAERPDDMCEVAKRYVGQDHESQHELSGFDTVQDGRGPDTTD